MCSAVTDPFVKVDLALRSLGGEIGSFVVYAQHLSPLSCFRPAVSFLLSMARTVYSRQSAFAPQRSKSYVSLALVNEFAPRRTNRESRRHSVSRMDVR